MTEEYYNRSVCWLRKLENGMDVSRELNKLKDLGYTFHT